MLIPFQNTLLQMLVALTLSVPGMQGLLQGASFEAAQQRYEQTVEERQSVIQEITRLEEKHKRLVQRITKLKRQNDSGLTARLALEDMLAQSKSLSDELGLLSDRIQAIDNTLSARRGALVGAVDREMRGLERSLAKASAAERRKIVGRLNALRAQRQTWAKPLPTGPSTGDVSAALNLAGEAEAPDELLAAADEIEDTEDQLSRRMKAIDSRIQELKQARRLMRRASEFSREEKFFEEVDRDRVIARYSEGSSAQAAERTPSNSANGDAAPSQSQNNAAQEDFAEPASEASNNVSLDADFAAGAPERVPNEEDVSESASAPPTFEETSGNADVFDTAGETVVINSAVDPSRSVGPNDERRGGSLETQIRSLESEKQRLESQAKRLKQRAKQLRDRASDL